MIVVHKKIVCAQKHQIKRLFVRRNTDRSLFGDELSLRVLDGARAALELIQQYDLVALCKRGRAWG